MLNVTTERIGDVLSIDVEGRIDNSNFDQFVDAVNAGIDESDRAVVVNLEKLDYIASQGLRAHLLTAKSLKKRDAELLLCSLSDRVREVFRVTGLDRIGTIFSSKEDALASLNLPKRPARAP